MSNPMQFITDGKIHATLDNIPYDGFVSSNDVGEKMKINPSLAAARLKILLDNGVVYRKRENGKYWYTRNKSADLTSENPMNSTRTPGIRVLVASFLRDHVGDTLTTMDIMNATGGTSVDISSLMSDLVRLGYVDKDKYGYFMPNDGINNYNPRGAVKQEKAIMEVPKKRGKQTKLIAEDFAKALTRLQQDRDKFQSALEGIQSILKNALK